MKKNIQVLFFDEFSSSNFTTCLWNEMERLRNNGKINSNYVEFVVCIQPCEDVYITNYQLIGL